MLYLIGLGLDKKGISQEGLEIARRCKKVYLENYTVDFPYKKGELEEVLGKEINPVNRDFVESLGFIDEAVKKDVALLVYGSPLTATTHIAIIEECKASGIKCEVIYSASVFDGILETGLQFYKFGKVASMPVWIASENYKPDSFMKIVKDNQKIDAHSLILIDIGLEIEDALGQLQKAAKNHGVKLGKLVLCQRVGAEKKNIFYGTIEEIKERAVKKPYCLIIPSKKLHDLERKSLEGFSE